MNKQELIKKYENEWKEHSPFNETASYALMVKSFLDQLKKMDEPQKVTIPQFVADWIEQRKDEGWKLSQMFLQANLEKKYGRWIIDNQETFARAWLDGYAVEKEKRYYVRLKNVDENYNYLTCIKHLDAWALTEIKRDKKFRTEHTKKQLEEGGFGEVFDSQLFEVEEVEE
ncbi:DUF1642 domain-containing protein [Streptococcus parasanguinis]|uniref:DUF1642 domain-containing protein n=1 Tax=Streptococcus parasanguinis TaxID=1318 RepID=UPI0004E2525D|nr:DUF1642 domain-containing protein [Streptococcus parasanguinis]